MKERIDLTKLPEGALQKRRRLLQPALEMCLEQSLQFVESDYADGQLLDECICFMSHNMLDAARSDWTSLQKVWYFPWREAARELEEALNCILYCSYKAVYDNLRRGLELSLCGVYFTLDSVPTPAARAWIDSRAGTPFFSSTLKKLLENPRFSKFDDETGWADKLKEFNWRLSDVIHTRGQENSLSQMQPSNHNICGVSMPRFNAAAARLALDTYIEAVRETCVAISIGNPVLLVGLPLDEKFGLNPPFSGFFNDTQAERLRLLLPDAYRDPAVTLANEDDEVEDVLAWIHSKPDLTKEDFEAQVLEFAEEWNVGAKP